MAKFTRTEFIVRGDSPFPLDMLRYDSCFPESEPDSSVIRASIESPYQGPRDVVLVTIRKDAPQGRPPVTPDRWKSFGWQIVDVVTIRW